MPDGSVLYRCTDVDRYYGLKLGLTKCRLKQCWSVEHCANNQHKINLREHRFEMPDGSVLTIPREVDEYYHLNRGTRRFEMPDGSIFTTCAEVDRYYNLYKGNTACRLKQGWTEEMCASNFKGKYTKFEFHMPDGSILYSTRDVDKYYSLRSGKTYYRLRYGWTIEECTLNKKG